MSGWFDILRRLLGWPCKPAEAAAITVCVCAVEVYSPGAAKCEAYAPGAARVQSGCGC